MRQQSYNSLFNVNIVLDKIEGASLDAGYKTEVKAEMMFLRALYYFAMVQTWGDIPLVTKPVTAKESYNVLRSPARIINRIGWLNIIIFIDLAVRRRNDSKS